MPTNKKIKNYQPWLYNGKEIKSSSDMPEGCIGYIYRLYNRNTKRYYIGRKTVFSKSKVKLTVKEKLLSENFRKTWKIINKENTSWKNYHGSNTTLKEEVSKGHVIDREIICFCFSKAEMTLKESSEILCSGALEDVSSYNDWISCKIYKKFLINKN